ncbi:hypothetical protein PHAVU_011G137515 [Phaseolus vulgaris]
MLVVVAISTPTLVAVVHYPMSSSLFRHCALVQPCSLPLSCSASFFTKVNLDRFSLLYRLCLGSYFTKVILDKEWCVEHPKYKRCVQIF